MLEEPRRSEECRDFITEALDLRTALELMEHPFIKKKDFEGKNYFLVHEFTASMIELMENMIK